MSRFITCGLMILLAFAPAALAVDGTVLINQSTITNGLTGCPTGGHFPIVICQSGSYRLSGNLTIPDANTTAIQITAIDVTIDLNGFSILGPGTKGSGIGIASAAINTSVSNGTIRGMGSTGISILFSGQAYKIRAFANGADGIDASFVSECTSSGNAGNGISVHGTALNNITVGNSLNGIEGTGLITGNMINGNGINGILATDAVISANVIQFNKLLAISASCPANIIGNDASGTNGGGIATDAALGCLLVNNVTN